jgi:hypothetical protein
MLDRSRSGRYYGRVVLALASLSFMVSSPSAQPADTEARPVRVADDAAGLRQAAARERLQRDELSRRIQAAVEASGKVVAGLSAQAAAIRDPNRRVELDRRLAQAKRELQIELLRVQAQFARESGRLAQARDLDAQIAAATSPRTTKAAAPSDVAPATPASSGGAR